MFSEERNETRFTWDMLGDIELGRPNLGPSTPVAVYRLLQYALRDVLIRDYGVEKADAVFNEASRNAGREFYHNVLAEARDFSEFVNRFQQALKDLKVGILRVEAADKETGTYTVAVAEDLDCSGLPVTGETICTYDEGFLAGVFGGFAGKRYTARETDCWCSGGRVCRFEVRPA